MKRVRNGVFSDSFLQAHAGQKVAFLPAGLGYTLWEKDQDAIVVEADYHWTCVDNGVIKLSETEEVQTGGDGDFVTYESPEFVIFGGSKLGYIVYDF